MVGGAGVEPAIVVVSGQCFTVIMSFMYNIISSPPAMSLAYCIKDLKTAPSDSLIKLPTHEVMSPTIAAGPIGYYL